MSILERKQWQRKNVRIQIMNAALSLVRKDGWQAVSMRKIAEIIDYTPPVIYAYFRSKERLLLELSRMGFLKLARAMRKEAKDASTHQEKLERMWMAYWEFACKEEAFCQLMFGIGPSCRINPFDVAEVDGISEIVIPVIKQMYLNSTLQGSNAECIYNACWSMTHGLIALNFLNRALPNQLNKQLLLHAIRSISKAELLEL